MAASIALYDHYKRHESTLRGRQKLQFAQSNGLDLNALSEIDALISQFRDLLIDAGFLKNDEIEARNINSSNANFLQCCLVSGLYPNVAVLQRPKVTGKGGSLITKSKEKVGRDSVTSMCSTLMLGSWSLRRQNPT